MAVLSDIHSNWTYLQQVSNALSNDNVEKIIFLGDAIGYYNEPNYVLDWLKDLDGYYIKGNHEKYVLGELPFDSTKEKLYGIERHRIQIRKDNIDFIKSWHDKLELNFNGSRFLAVHADSNSSEKRIYSGDEIEKEVLKNYDYYLFGHTHLPLIQYYFGTCIVNPGSVGQPRDYTAKPSYALLDLSLEAITIKKVQVDIDRYVNELLTINYDVKVVSILKRQKNG